jgi:hypothetical protein
MHSPADGPADSATQRDSPQLQPIPDHIEDPVPGIDPNFHPYMLPKDRTQAQPIQTLEGSMDKNAAIQTHMEDDDFNESLYYLHTPNGYEFHWRSHSKLKMLQEDEIAWVFIRQR